MQALSFTSDDVASVMRSVGVDHDQEEVLRITSKTVDPQKERIERAGMNSPGYRFPKRKDAAGLIREFVHTEIATILFEDGVIPEHPDFRHSQLDCSTDYREWVLLQSSPHLFAEA